MYWLWTVAFAWKLIGAAWDMSSHFKHLRDTLWLPHIVNTGGFLLALGLTLYQSRHRRQGDNRSLRLIRVGLAIFRAGMPADELYHRAPGAEVKWDGATRTIQIIRGN